jgi:HK97 family phage portal protein
MIAWAKRLYRSLMTTSIRNPASWLFDALGASESDSGVKITRDTVLGLSPVFRAVNQLSSDTAKLPCVLYKRAGDGKEPDKEHPAYSLLRWKPNKDQTAFIWWKLAIAQAVLQGNHYSYISRLGSGDPVELIPLDPDCTYPVRANGELWYVVEVNGEHRKLTADSVIHFKGFGWDWLQGLSLFRVAADTFGLGIATRKYASKFFKNNARPSVVLEAPQNMSEPAVKTLRESWERLHSGLDNTAKVAVLTNGVKLNPYSINPQESQLLESRKLDVREVANYFTMPPHKLGDDTRTSHSSLEEENQSYLDEALDPWLVNVEQECRDKLLTEEQKANDTHSVEFLRQALARANMQVRGNFYSQALAAGWMNKDEVRSRENMNPIPDGSGKKYLSPVNMGDPNANGKAGNDAPPDPGNTGGKPTP